MKLKWINSLEIALVLIDKYPDINPSDVRFTQLRDWILALDDFDDDPNHCGEHILEAIQMAWIDEFD